MKTKRILLFGTLSFLLLLLILAVWFFQFTYAGYRMTVPHRSSFERISENLYINKENPESRESVISLIDQAKERVRTFFGDLQSPDNTIMIICDDDYLLSKLGGDHDTVTVYFPFRKNCISVSNEYFNIDILAHELTHAELHTRLSANALRKIPSWFDEGLALQNDYRERYGLEAWIEQTDNGKKIVPLEDMDEPSEFYAGTVEDRRFRYLNAKHEVSEWMETHKRQGLLKLIDRLNSGEDFSTAYSG